MTTPEQAGRGRSVTKGAATAGDGDAGTAEKAVRAASTTRASAGTTARSSATPGAAKNTRRSSDAKTTGSAATRRSATGDSGSVTRENNDPTRENGSPKAGTRTASGPQAIVSSAGAVAGTVTNLAMTPVAIARRVLPAKRGLPLYAGLTGLGVLGVIEWPVAVAAGAGYAVAQWGRRDDSGRDAG